MHNAGQLKPHESKYHCFDIFSNCQINFNCSTKFGGQKYYVDTLSVYFKTQEQFHLWRLESLYRIQARARRSKCHQHFQQLHTKCLLYTNITSFYANYTLYTYYNISDLFANIIKPFCLYFTNNINISPFMLNDTNTLSSHIH